MKILGLALSKLCNKIQSESKVWIRSVKCLMDEDIDTWSSEHVYRE